MKMQLFPMKSPLEDVNPAVRPTEGQIALSEPLISSPYWPGTWNYRTGKYNDEQEKLPFRFWVFEDLGFEHLNCQTGKENYVKSLVDLHKDIRLILLCGGGEDKRCVESTVWKCEQCGSVDRNKTSRFEAHQSLPHQRQHYHLFR